MGPLSPKSGHIGYTEVNGKNRFNGNACKEAKSGFTAELFPCM
jgi:hypothetical protein